MTQQNNLLIKTKLENDKLTISLTGRLDTLTSPNLEKIIEQEAIGIKLLVIDCAQLYYISSSGLRILMMAYRKMQKENGKLLLDDVNDVVRDILDITGFSDILEVRMQPKQV